VNRSCRRQKTPGRNLFEPTRFGGPNGPDGTSGEFGFFRRFLGLFIQNSDRIFRQPKPFWSFLGAKRTNMDKCEELTAYYGTILVILKKQKAPRKSAVLFTLGQKSLQLSLFEHLLAKD
jgi:hypothetical protein